MRAPLHPSFFHSRLQHGQRASLKLHGDLLDVCTHATVAFFDTTPVGRILNRFSKDMDNLDTTISFNLQQFVRNALQLLALVGFIAYGSPWLLLAIGPTFVMLWFYLLYFRRTTVRLQRIEGEPVSKSCFATLTCFAAAITLSPIFQHFSETLPGLSTVRAYGMTAAEAMRSMTYINGGEKNALESTRSRSHRPNPSPETLVEFAIRSVDAWIGIRLDILCFVCLVVVCYVMVGLRDTLNSYVAGFTINYMLATVQFLGYLSLNMTQMETQMNAVERIIEYSDGVPQEAPFDIPENDPPPEWPQEGRIDFENVQFRYREGLPLVLNGVSLSILVRGASPFHLLFLIAVCSRRTRWASWAARARESHRCWSSCCVWLSSPGAPSASTAWILAQSDCTHCAAKWPSSRRSPRCLRVRFAKIWTRSSSTRTTRSGMCSSSPAWRPRWKRTVGWAPWWSRTA